MYFTAVFIFGLFVSCFINDFGISHHWEKKVQGDSERPN